ncbi:3'-N-debenzoyl-2'-deoxytaxol N-benzoyltransferase [Musa troglodytarum]|uniref:3'-N-debenzoyl-2'-deoxytaxol N-benzoyltransferase n=1 Tax=Musa troglodytarum TaxID=320322 RepID=A0A9E7KAE1_9LILI|nr:3'-N-debenzoyl-2'-deoxytaxol N-benzoyltransferase [Musa troglodytarum]
MSFSVNKLAPELLVAAEPTPSGRLPLSCMDRIAAVRVLVDTISVFQKGLEPAKAIKAALSRALVPYYPVAGRIVETSPGEPRSPAPAKACGSSRPPLKDVNNLELPVVLPKEELIPFAPAEVKEEDLIMMMQVTEFTCGGFAVGTRLSHVVFDGLGAAQFLKAVAEIARGHARPLVDPVWCRDAIPSRPKLSPGLPLPSIKAFHFENSVFDILRPHGRSQEPVLEGDGPAVLHLRRGHGHDLAVPDAGDMLRRPRRRAPRLRRQQPPLAAGVAAAGRLLRQLRVPHGNQGESWNHRWFLAGGGDRADTRRQGEDIDQVLGLDDGGDYGGGPYRVKPGYGTLVVSDWRRMGFSEVNYGWGEPIHVTPLNDDSNFVASCIYLSPPKPKQGLRLITQCFEKDHLPAFDEELMKMMIDLILVFQQGVQPANAMRAALSRALPIPGEAEVDCTADGVWFVEASVDCSLEDVNNLERPLLLPRKDLIPYAPPDVIEGDLAFMLQVTEFTCGGFAVGIRFNHTVFDGLGAAQFSKAVAELARGHACPLVKPSAEAFATTCTLARWHRLRDLRVRHLHRPDQRVEEPILQETGQKCSTFDVVTAMLWQCRTRAISLGPHADMHLGFAANARHLLRGLLPQEGFYGNCVYPMGIKANARIIAGSSPVEVIELIRAAKTRMAAMFLDWMMGYADDDPYEVPLEYGTLVVSDWCRVGFSEVDYGWGEPIHVVPLNDDHNFIPSCIYLEPSKPKQGVRLMTRCVQKEHLPAFTEEMKQFLVAPAEPTPSGRLPLSFIDRNVMLRLFVDLILVFEHGVQPAKAVRAALSRALVPYYPVAGRIVEPIPEALLIGATAGYLFKKL